LEGVGVPYRLDLPKKLRQQEWKVKIRDKERLEPPHVTVWQAEVLWRICLRTGGFLVPPGGSWNLIDSEVRAIIENNWELLCNAWDEKYPENPVSSLEQEDNG
jgi:hypothetical protein